MKAVILAGGQGTRISSTCKDIPKPLIDFNAKPVLQYQIENLRRYGIKDIILVIGHLGHKIKEYFGDGCEFGVNLEYYIEESPLGTAGALFYLRSSLKEDFVLMYGDTIFDIDFKRFIAFHKEKKSLYTLSCHPNNHPYDSDILIVNESHVVTNLLRKNGKRDFYYNNCVNAGIYIFNTHLLNYIEENKKQDLERDIIQRLIPEGTVYGYKTSEYIKDMGTPDRYKLVQQHLSRGIVEKKNLSRQQKAVFLDRDGTINNYVGLLTHPDELEISPEVYKAIKMINDSEYISIVITNQPVVARNLCSIEQLDNIHRKMETLLGDNGVYVDDIYYCPHHPDKGYPEEIKELKIECGCRKPKTGLIDEAAKRYNIDLSKSYFIGDSTVDIQTGYNAGLKTILLATGQAGSDNKYKIEPDFYADNLLQAIEIIFD